MFFCLSSFSNVKGNIITLYIAIISCLCFVIPCPALLLAMPTHTRIACVHVHARASYANKPHQKIKFVRFFKKIFHVAYIGNQNSEGHLLQKNFKKGVDGF